MSQETTEEIDVTQLRRESWLVTISLILVILLEVWPTEVGLLHIAVRSNDIVQYVGMKLVFLAVILLPLVFYFRSTGLRGYRHATNRINAIAVIMLLHLAMNVMFAFQWIYDRPR